MEPREGQRNRRTTRNVSVTDTVPMYLRVAAQAGRTPQNSQTSRIRAVKAQNRLERTVK